MMLNVLLFVLIVTAALVGYVAFVRPALKATPSLKYFYEEEESWLRAIRAKFVGLKQKIVTFLLSVAAVVVTAYDQLAPYFVDAGVDPGLLLPKVPPYVWPIVSVAILWTIQHFRNIADKNAAANAAALIAVGEPLAAPAPAVPLPVEEPSSAAAKG